MTQNTQLTENRRENASSPMSREGMCGKKSFPTRNVKKMKSSTTLSRSMWATCTVCYVMFVGMNLRISLHDTRGTLHFSIGGTLG